MSAEKQRNTGPVQIIRFGYRVEYGHSDADGTFFKEASERVSSFEEGMKLAESLRNRGFNCVKILKGQDDPKNCS